MGGRVGDTIEDTTKEQKKESVDYGKRKFRGILQSKSK